MPLTLADQVRERLAAYGTTEDEVADTLRAAEVTGRRHSAFGCPIAVDLHRTFRQLPKTFAVTKRGVFIYTRDLGTYPEIVPAPGAVTGFVRAVDGPGGRYADLIEAAATTKPARRIRIRHPKEA